MPSNRSKVGCLFAAALLASGPAAAQDAYDRVNQGNDFYRDGDYAAAAVEYRAAAESLPQSAEVHFNLANSLLKAFKYIAAEEHYSHALRFTRDRLLEARIRFNMGNLKYQQANNAMRTFRDARPSVKAAVGYFRDSLAIDPDQPDARFNLELAHFMVRQLRQQEAQNTGRGDSKEKDTARNTGENVQQGKAQSRSRDDDTENQDDDRKGKGQEAQQASQEQASMENASQIDQANSPQEMSPDTADEMVKLMQQRAKASKEQRRQWRRARMHDSAIEKYW